ncbi:hypothetical protein H8356DRAFT_1354898 [Neocallimastix lanati (nom. inval.)]|nr:hypothetical protein H8356DRAFT_1354898 [Neocallimastix sp. JGI-2020a]
MTLHIITTRLNNKIIPRNNQSIEDYQSLTFSEALNEVIDDNPNIASQVSDDSVIKSDEFVKMACRKNQVTFNTNISQFNSYMLYVSSYISNDVLALSIKPNINYVNALHNTGIAYNNINKLNKQYNFILQKQYYQK